MNPPALYDALYCASMSVLHAEGGDRDQSAIALFEASVAAADAFPEDSDEAKALSAVLDAVARVPEMTA